MNFKKIMFVAGLAVASCFTVKAQQEVETEYVFNPHLYVQGQVGLQNTLGEVSGLNSFNLQVAGGYNFTSVWGARLAINAFQSKGGVNLPSFKYEAKYKWNYVAPTVDLTMNLTNAIWGFNPERKWNVGVFAGIGANFAFGNDEAGDVKKAVNALPNVGDDVNALKYYWDSSQTSFVAQFGAMADYNLTDNWAVGLEAGFNTLSDKYNSKKAKNADWYFNFLAGVKYTFGETYSKKTRPAVAPCEPQVIEKEVIREVVREVPAAATAKEGPMRRDIYYKINRADVNNVEMAKLEEIVAYLNRNPQATVTVTGYADKGTGNRAINMRYAKQRAQKVVELLTKKFNISASRITSDAKGDTEQPYDQNDLNRVSIVIAQ